MMKKRIFSNKLIRVHVRTLIFCYNDNVSIACSYTELTGKYKLST